MKAYVDSSVVIRWLLKEPGAFLRWSALDLAVASELQQVEVFRTLDRLRILGRLTDAEIAEKTSLFRRFTASLEVLPLARPVLQRAAAPFPTVLGALDAIHLATALLWIEDNSEPLTFLTHDGQLAVAARASGLDVRV